MGGGAGSRRCALRAMRCAPYAAAAGTPRPLHRVLRQPHPLFLNAVLVVRVLQERPREQVAAAERVAQVLQQPRQPVHLVLCLVVVEGPLSRPPGSSAGGVARVPGWHSSSTAAGAALVQVPVQACMGCSAGGRATLRPGAFWVYASWRHLASAMSFSTVTMHPPARRTQAALAPVVVHAARTACAIGRHCNHCTAPVKSIWPWFQASPLALTTCLRRVRGTRA